MTATGPNRSRNRPRTPEQATGVPVATPDAPDATQSESVDHTRAALDAIQEARTTGGTQGTTYALTAIAYAILARTENP